MKTVRVFLSIVALFATPLVAQETAKSAKKETANVQSVASLERSIYDALTRNDVPAFNKALGGDFVYVSPEGADTWQLAKSAEMLKDCKTGKWTLAKIQEKRVTEDLVVLTYTASGEQTCGGKKSPSPINALSVWRRVGGQWVAIAHSETPTSAPAK